MAHVEDRWHRTVKLPDGSQKKERTARYGVGRRWKVRYLVDGRERGPTYQRKTDADNECARINAEQALGTFVDPAGGRITVREYGQKQWLPSLRPSNRDQVEGRMRNHVFDHLGDRQLRSLRPSTARSWVTRLQEEKGLGNNWVRGIYSTFSAMLDAAVDDGLIAKNPFDAASVRAPEQTHANIVPWTAEMVAAMRAELGDALGGFVDAGAGCGLRQGECFGLGIDSVAGDDLNEDRRILHVRRQIRIVRQRLVFAPPKRGKQREVPASDEVIRRLLAHRSAHPPVPVTLPWIEPAGKPVTVELFLPGPNGGWWRDRFNKGAWQPALRRAGIPAVRQNGTHALRHWYASTQLEGGTSIRALAAYLGHDDPGFTLRVYAHLMPSSEERSRTVIDLALTGRSADVLAFRGRSADVPVTSQEAK
jgi:integrase